MEQSINYQRYLITGINMLVIVLFIFSCGDTEDEDVLTTQFVYKNLIPENVQLNLYDKQNINYKNYSILPNEEIFIYLV